MEKRAAGSLSNITQPQFDGIVALAALSYNKENWLTVTVPIFLVSAVLS